MRTGWDRLVLPHLLPVRARLIHVDAGAIVNGVGIRILGHEPKKNSESVL